MLANSFRLISLCFTSFRLIERFKKKSPPNNDSKVSVMEDRRQRVLVTGASGYLAIHCVHYLLRTGYLVRGTVRDLNCNEKIGPLKLLTNSENLELFQADLDDDVAIWEKAAQDCNNILHVASPCLLVTDANCINTAVNGTLNVLRGASRTKTVRKVVVTSSCGAVNEGYSGPKKVFDERDWTNLKSKKVHPYHKSKTLAEQAAWNFMKENPEVSFKLTVLNPSLLVGPLMQNAKGASVGIISRFLDGSMPAYPALKVSLVDVRDAAWAHIVAMTDSKSDNERILITAETMSFAKIAKLLRKEFGPQGYRVPRFKAPYLGLWLYSLFDSEARQALRLYGHEEYFDNTKARELLKLSFTDPKKSLLEMANDMIDRSILPKRKQSAPEIRKRSTLTPKHSIGMYPKLAETIVL